MAESNLFKLLKEAIRDKNCTSANDLQIEERVSESDSDLSCSERNVGSYCSENAHHSILSSSSDLDTDLAEMNIKVPEWKIFSQEALGSDSSKAVKEHKVTQKFCSNEENQQKKKNNNQSQCYNKMYSEIEFNMNLDNQQSENEFTKTHFYSNKLSESDFKTRQSPPTEKRFIRSSFYTNRNTSNYALQMTEDEADNEARRVLGEAAKFRPYTIKESMNDLSGCGVDVFKVFEYHRNFKKQIEAESLQNASKQFEIDVPLTGVLAKMKHITREDIITDPPVPFEEEAWDDDLLF